VAVSRLRTLNNTSRARTRRSPSPIAGTFQVEELQVLLFGYNAGAQQRGADLLRQCELRHRHARHGQLRLLDYRTRSAVLEAGLTYR
jgi:hypothetical protein